METTDTRQHPPIAAAPSVGERPEWPRILRYVGLSAGLCMIGLFAAFGAASTAAAKSPLMPAYTELASAVESPLLYRVGSIFDVAVWLALGVMFVGFGAFLAARAKVRSILIAACGVGQLAGAIGAFTRLGGVTHLAHKYVNASDVEQAELMRSSLDLELVINSHFAAGSLLWTTALFLVASVAWHTTHFPRSLVGVMAVTGVLNLTTDVLGAVTSDGAPDAIGLLPLVGMIFVFFGVGRAFRPAAALAAKALPANDREGSRG